MSLLLDRMGDMWMSVKANFFLKIGGSLEVAVNNED